MSSTSLIFTGREITLQGKVVMELFWTWGVQRSFSKGAAGEARATAGKLISAAARQAVTARDRFLTPLPMSIPQIFHSNFSNLPPVRATISARQGQGVAAGELLSGALSGMVLVRGSGYRLPASPCSVSARLTFKASLPATSQKNLRSCKTDRALKAEKKPQRSVSLQLLS